MNVGTGEVDTGEPTIGVLGPLESVEADGGEFVGSETPVIIGDWTSSVATPEGATCCCTGDADMGDVPGRGLPDTGTS